MIVRATSKLSNGREYFPYVSLLEQYERHYLVFHGEHLNLSNVDLEKEVSGNKSGGNLKVVHCNPIGIEKTLEKTFKLFNQYNDGNKSLFDFVAGSMSSNGLCFYNILKGSF